MHIKYLVSIINFTFILIRNQGKALHNKTKKGYLLLEFICLFGIAAVFLSVGIFWQSAVIVQEKELKKRFIAMIQAQSILTQIMYDLPLEKNIYKKMVIKQKNIVPHALGSYYFLKNPHALLISVSCPYKERSGKKRTITLWTTVASKK